MRTTRLFKGFSKNENDKPEVESMGSVTENLSSFKAPICKITLQGKNVQAQRKKQETQAKHRHCVFVVICSRRGERGGFLAVQRLTSNVTAISPSW